MVSTCLEYKAVKSGKLISNSVVSKTKMIKHDLSKAAYYWWPFPWMTKSCFDNRLVAFRKLRAPNFSSFNHLKMHHAAAQETKNLVGGPSLGAII